MTLLQLRLMHAVEQAHYETVVAELERLSLEAQLSETGGEVEYETA